MKAHAAFRKIIAAAFLCAAALAFPNGLINAEAASVVRTIPGKSAMARGKQLAILHSYLLTDSVTVGLDTGECSTAMSASIQHGLKVWSDALTDSPFVLAHDGDKPMVKIRFVDSIDSGEDVQGQVAATRTIHWGSSVSYKLEATLLVCRTTGRRELRDDELSEVIAHELGHLLGLTDAENCIGLMGPFVPGKARTKPSTAEIDAVTEYRQQLRDAIAKLDK